MASIAAWLPVVLPLLMAVGGLVSAMLKHQQHSILSEVLEEALVLEREREGGTPLCDLLGEAATSQASKDMLSAIVDRVAARKATP